MYYKIILMFVSRFLILNMFKVQYLVLRNKLHVEYLIFSWKI